MAAADTSDLSVPDIPSSPEFDNRLQQYIMMSSFGNRAKVMREERQGRGFRRGRILQEATACLNGRGVLQTSLAAIARQAGISRAALYYYVKDRQDLVFQCYRQACEVMAGRLGAARKRPGGALDVVAAFIDGMTAGDAPEIALLSEIAYLRPEQQQDIRQLHESVMAELCDVLETGMRGGQIRRCRSPVVAQAIIGLVSWIPVARHWPTTVGVASTDLIAAARTICMDGIAADRQAELDYRPLDLPVPSIPLTDLFDNARLAEAKREALLAAASWQFNLKGIDATSLDEIALAVGVTPKVIYHNVGDKEALVTGCYRRGFEHYLSLAERADAYPGSRLQAICAGVHALAEATLREEIAPLSPLSGFDSVPRHVQREIEKMVSRLLARYTAMYARGQAEGSVRPFDIHAVLAIRHATHKWLPAWYGQTSAAERAVVPRELADFTRLGLAPLPRAPRRGRRKGTVIERRTK